MTTETGVGQILFSPTRAEVICAGKKAALGEAATACLKLLLTHQGNIVNKTQIFEACWGTRGIMVSDASVRQVITQVRRALVSVGASADVLTTQPRQGYSLTPGVVTEYEGETTLPPVPVNEKAEPVNTRQATWSGYRLLIMCGVISLIVSVTIVWFRYTSVFDAVTYRLQNTTPAGSSVYVQSGYESPAGEAGAVETAAQKGGYAPAAYRHIYLNKTDLSEFTSAFICEAPMDHADSHCVSMVIVRGDHGY